jgi:acylphosphatase
MRTVRLTVTGRVQGVAYRAWAVRTATARGLRGWVRNRLDGSVEALVTGGEADVVAMIDACRRGPPAARVSNVRAVEDADDGSTGFEARPTA